MPVELAEKIRTEIEGEVVERKVRACVHGLKKRKEVSYREKTIGDYLVELAEVRTRNTVVSRRAKKWGSRILKKNRAARVIADNFHKKKFHK